MKHPFRGFLPFGKYALPPDEDEMEPPAKHKRENVRNCEVELARKRMDWVGMLFVSLFVLFMLFLGYGLVTLLILWAQ